MSASWRPTASWDVLRLRASVTGAIRAYFAEHGVTEVTTPLLTAYGSTDPALRNLEVREQGTLDEARRWFLQTSPEAAMKRLLVSGCGDIYQICPAFRGDETGRLHQPEFQLVEWYRLGFDHHRLMNDVESLVQRILPEQVFERRTYTEVFEEYTGLDPHALDPVAVAARIEALHVVLDADDFADRALILDLLFSHLVIPALAHAGAIFVYDFPVEQAAYAQLRKDHAEVAERFELLIDGVEIANGYRELTDAAEQARRHARENDLRVRRGLPRVAVDVQLAAGLTAGLPPCAGVALGVDRLMMVRAKRTEISEVVSFGAESRS